MPKASTKNAAIAANAAAAVAEQVTNATIANVAEETTEEEENNRISVVSVRILKVISAADIKDNASDEDEDRIIFRTDKPILKIDMATGEEVESDSFSMNIYNLVNQIGASVPEIQLADCLCGGARINTKVLSLALTNAEVKLQREFHAAGETRENGIDVYSSDCIVSKIMSVKTHIAPQFAQFLMQLINTQPSEPIKANPLAVNPNPFNI